MDDQINLTVGGLMRALQDIATLADADYEQATAPFIMHANPDDTTDDWTLFKVDPTGKAVAVIS